MQERPSVIERAFEIAKSGKVADLDALRAQLAAENYTNSVQALAGRSIANQLARRIQAARVKLNAQASNDS
ncbi:MAG TPA: hypothetical protein VNW15_14580 [Rhizomicrobium sp.]|jgi:hypothetical protein|nr:hypothetical protein [Rhizomicrobium sp.]